MYQDRNGRRRWLIQSVLLLLFVRFAAAEEGILVLVVTDPGQHPFAGVRIGAQGDGGSPQTTDQNGKARLRLASNTKPAAWVTLQLLGGPNDMDLVFLSPYDSRVRVPPFDNEQENYDPIVVVKRGDKNMLESGTAMLAVHATASRAAAQSKKPATKSQYRLPVGQARLIPVALGPDTDNQSNDSTDRSLPQSALEAVSQAFGLSVSDIEAAIADWGGSQLAWKAIMLTASIEAGGTDPFSFLSAGGGDISFGAGNWTLRGCSLQPMLLKFQQGSPELFSKILGKDDAEWLAATMSGQCDVSSRKALERMLEGGAGMLSPHWREKFRKLGNEPVFQRLQVKEMTRQLNEAQTQASAFGLTSEQAALFCFYVSTQTGSETLSSQQWGYAKDVVALKRLSRRDPPDQEKLLLLANRVFQSQKCAGGLAFTPAFAAKSRLLAQADGVVFDREYHLGEFQVGRIDGNSGANPSLSDNKEILEKLASGWLPTQPDTVAPGACSSPAVGAPGFGQYSSSACPTGLRPDQTAEGQLVVLINRERTERSLGSLQVDARLSEVARQHSAQMSRIQTVSHQVAGELPLDQRFAEKNIRSSFAGENLAMGADAASLHQRLMGEAEHRAITLHTKFNSIGVGVVRCGDSIYVTEDYAQLEQNYSNDQAANVVQDALSTYATNHGLNSPVRKQQVQLQQFACDMARTHKLDVASLQSLPGVQNLTAWFTANLNDLPSGPTEALTQTHPLEYSLGSCFDTHANGYWVVMVTY